MSLKIHLVVNSEEAQLEVQAQVLAVNFHLKSSLFWHQLLETLRKKITLLHGRERRGIKGVEDFR